MVPGKFEFTVRVGAIGKKMTAEEYFATPYEKVVFYKRLPVQAVMYQGVMWMGGNYVLGRPRIELEGEYGWTTPIEAMLEPGCKTPTPEFLQALETLSSTQTTRIIEMWNALPDAEDPRQMEKKLLNKAN